MVRKRREGSRKGKQTLDPFGTSLLTGSLFCLPSQSTPEYVLPSPAVPDDSDPLPLPRAAPLSSPRRSSLRSLLSQSSTCLTRPRHPRLPYTGATFLPLPQFAFPSNRSPSLLPPLLSFTPPRKQCRPVPEPSRRLSRPSLPPRRFVPLSLVEITRSLELTSPGGLPLQFLDVILSKTQRKTPTVIRSGFKISRIRAFCAFLPSFLASS